LDRFPHPDDWFVLRKGVRLQLAGPALNMASHLASLGHRVELTGPVGLADREKLRSEGPDLADDTRVAWIQGHSDLIFTVRTPEAESGHFAVYQCAELTPAVLQQMEHSVSHAGLLILTGSRHIPIQHLYMELARKSSQPLIFAPNYATSEYPAEILHTLVQRASLVALNKWEAQYTCQQLGCESVVGIAKHAHGTLVVTYAERGAQVYPAGRDPQDPVVVESMSGCKEDVLGSGDAFLSAFIDANLLRKTVIEEASYWAAAAAASFIDSVLVEAAAPALNRSLVDEKLHTWREQQGSRDPSNMGRGKDDKDC
jgi:sugar/nucleoside kinase (ribokinase family)